MIALRKLLLPGVFCCFLFTFVDAQRTYKANSVLGSGNWFKISVAADGVYKMDVAFLNSLGLTGPIPSAQIRVFGSGGGLLPEKPRSDTGDDIEENAVWVEDGGDGVLNGADYVLFYGQGPDHWVKDSVNQRFAHQKNLYSDKTYYFVSVGGAGLRIATQSGSLPAATTVNSFDERYFHELDTVNFLSSGKEWFGEEFSNFPGRSLNRTFQLPLSDLLPQQATMVTNVVARSVNVVSRFAVSANSLLVQQVTVPPIGTGTYEVFAQQVEQKDNFLLNGNTVSISINYTQGSFNSQGWLNWFEFFARRSLSAPGGKQLLFRDWRSVGTDNVQFLVSNADASSQVWDVTDSLHPVKMNGLVSANQLQFTNDAQRLREYVCFSTNFFLPKAEARVANQDLHSSTEKDLLIVTSPEFLQEAQRLAQFHQERDKQRTAVVTTEQVYNEFSSGSPDPTAIRDFAKMYYDRYRSTWAQTGKYLLLLGKASFDYKNRIANNTNKVPSYESANSLDPLSTYTSDDYFGFLDDNADINSSVIINQLNIGVGRIPARSVDEAKNFVDKVFAYHSTDAFGTWRNNLNFIADDEDNNLHLQDAETLTATTSSVAPLFNQQKIYLDAFHQESGSAGGRYPQANAVINSNIYNGTLLWNYSGHGGPARLAEEDILDQQIVNGWSNGNRLPLFITATCDFAPYDNPTENSLGENLLVRPKTGAIALMTTTRVVFAFSNRIINNNYLKFALEPDANGRYKTLGEALVASKNFTYQSSGDVTNNRKFTLLGDPAMRLAFPTYKVKIVKVNGKDISSQVDTLSATEPALMEGEVDDNSGALLASFNGTAYLSLFDKPLTITTLGNDPTSQPAPFSDQESTLFKGKASVQNGKFMFRFKVPKDINYQYGNGKISLYAHDGINDANGFSNSIIIGGISTTLSPDNQGPEIKAYLNDDKFVNGSIANANPILLLELADSSGINTGSSGIGHDIVATVDNNNSQYFVLNNFYEAGLDNFQKGTVRFQLPQLSAGHHTLKIKAWDVVNNSSEYVLDFTVVNTEELRIDHVLNYPNPFTTRTFFWFEHNQPGTDLSVKVEIFTVSGKLIKTISQTINTIGNRSNEIEWDGRDEYGEKIGRGVYVYRLRVKTPNGKTANKWERLVVLDK
jgi:hypothetical protein